MDDLYVIEVAPGRRTGRGRYWAPNAAGYTDHILLAGAYSWEDALHHVGSSSDDRILTLRDALAQSRRYPKAGSVGDAMGYGAIYTGENT